jgi:hypothetical protein
MNKTIGITYLTGWVVPVYLCLVLVSCTTTPPATPKGEIIEAFNQIERVKGYHFTCQIIQESGSPLMKLQQSQSTRGIHQNPDLTQMTLTLAGTEMQTYIHGSNAVLQDPRTGEWIKVAPQSPLRQIKLVKEMIKDVKFSGEEKIREKYCKVVEISVDQEQFRKGLPGSGVPIPDETKLDNLTVKVWVGKDDSRIYKIYYKVEGSAKPMVTIPGLDDDEEGKLELTMEMEFFDYNHEIEIELPKEAKELLGS